MALTKDDLKQIREVLQPSFDLLEKKLEKKLGKKIDDVERRITDAIGSIPDVMYREFPMREDIITGLNAFKKAIERPVSSL